MAEYKTRIQQKHAPSTDWAKATNFTPLDGEIIIYTDLNRFKICRRKCCYQSHIL